MNNIVSTADRFPVVKYISPTIGALLLMASGLFLADFKQINSDCSAYCDIPANACQYRDFCKTYEFFVLGASCGIIAGLIQIGTAVVGYFEKWDFWCLLHLVIFAFAILAFSFPMHQHASQLSSRGLSGSISDYSDSIAKLFLIMPGMDFVFAFLAIGIVLYSTFNR